MNIVEENWEQILNKMKLEYCSSNISYNTWIAPLTVYEVTDDTVYILVKLRASLEHIEEKYLLPFKVCIAEVTGYVYEVSFVTDDHVAPGLSVNLHPASYRIPASVVLHMINLSSGFSAHFITSA